MAFLKNLFNNESSRFQKRAFGIVAKINSLEPEFENLSDEELREKTEHFKKRLGDGETLEDLMVEAFACVREAAKRTLDQRHYDVQLVGGIVLHEGKIAEMKTGEGKTLASTLPVYLNALEGKGVHVVTVNDYLSRRDTVWMGQIYTMLGLSVGCLNHDTAYLYDASYKNELQDEKRDTLGSFKVVHEYLRPVSRGEVYRADVTYGTNNEFGFDYLRDNLVFDEKQLSQRNKKEGSWNFAIIDEIDSILIDEARTPLIISRPDEESGKLYQKFSQIVPQLQNNTHYDIDEKMRTASLSQEGISKIEKILGIKNLYGDGGMKMVHHLEQALKANVLFKLDRDYVVKDGEVVIVDAFTGRMMPGRRYSDGLHQALEAKEKVQIQKESRTVATITFQNYFRMYGKLSGMTGTALTSQEEFFKVYGLEVLEVPTAKPIARKDKPDRIYRSEDGKFKAVAREIKRAHENNQPVLVGTVSVEKNEYLSALLNSVGVPHRVLNAKNHETEAEIVAQAGKLGGVTVATNMAGRGVDIVLGGNPPDSGRFDKVIEVGGLLVLGTERHDARRIDNQLRGRAGRQGDVGESQFFVSLEDNLMRIFGGEKIKQMMVRLNIPEDEPIQSSIVSKALESAQGRIEGYHFDSRKHVLEYDEVINKHRETIYRMRRDLIATDNTEVIKKEVSNLLEDEARTIISQHTSESGNIEHREIALGLRNMVPMADDVFERISKELKKIRESDKVFDKFLDYINRAYKEKEGQLGEITMRTIEKTVLLSTLDELWMDHLEQMDYVKSSVGLRAYGQRDPLVEYKTEGHRLFQELLANLQTKVSQLVFKIEFTKAPQESAPLQFKGAIKNSSSNKVSPISNRKKVGRNEMVKITDGEEVKELKYKKAEPLLEGGKWKIV